MHRLVLHGLEIESEFPLAGWASRSTRPADVRIVAGASSVSPTGMQAIAGRSGRYAFSVHRASAGFLLDFPRVARFLVEPGRVEVLPTGDNDGLTQALLEGAALSALVVAKGDIALHASAVETAGRIIVFIGGSGAGKSTLAALLCSAGARLVADDVLRVARVGDGITCFSGASRLRLRGQARQLASCLTAWECSETGDGRLGLVAPEDHARSGPIDMLVFPRMDAASLTPRLRPLRGADAFVELLRAPRIPGWTDQEVLRTLHARLADLARVTPAYRLTLPKWELGSDTAQRLMALLVR